ncbi:hypothetical protein ONZ45_g4327 [Pleurotus djamor]|nr:hypothetical protein ONZ45_g4327 [Pleurotus djamor]
MSSSDLQKLKDERLTTRKLPEIESPKAARELWKAWQGKVDEATVCMSEEDMQAVRLWLGLHPTKDRTELFESVRMNTANALHLEQCEVNVGGKQDEELKNTYEGLPKLKAAYFTQDKPVPLKHHKFSEWAAKLTFHQYLVAKAVVTFEQRERLANLSRANPCNIIATAYGTGNSHFLAEATTGKFLKCISGIKITESDILGKDEGAGYRFIQGKAVVQEYERMVATIGMVMGQEVMDAWNVMYGDEIRFKVHTAPVPDDGDSVYGDDGEHWTTGKDEAVKVYDGRHDKKLIVAEDRIFKLPRFQQDELERGSFACVCYTVTTRKSIDPPVGRIAVTFNLMWAVVIGGEKDSKDSDDEY